VKRRHRLQRAYEEGDYVSALTAGWGLKQDGVQLTAEEARMYEEALAWDRGESRGPGDR
jgi:hypothetical protein